MARGPTGDGPILRVKMHYRWCQPIPVRIGQQARHARLHNGDRRVRRAQVNARDKAHVRVVPSRAGKIDFRLINAR